jgi:hypothetical protein
MVAVLDASPSAARLRVLPPASSVPVDAKNQLLTPTAKRIAMKHAENAFLIAAHVLTRCNNREAIKTHNKKA